MLEHQGSADLMQRHGDGFTTQAMFDYFAGEIFQKLDAASQEILLQTSFLPIMTRRLAEQLTGLHQAGELLSELNRRNYFTIRKPLPEPVYQYHPLFREFLLTQARKQLTDTQLIQTQRRAAEILEGAGQAEDAIILYSQTGDWASMVRIILTHSQTMIPEGRNKTLEEWIKQIPQAVVNETPWLLYWLGICRMPFSPPEARQHFEKTFEAFKQIDDITGQLLSWCGIVDTYVYEWGDFHQLNRWIVELEQLMQGNTVFPSDEIESNIACRMFMALIYCQPHSPALPKWEQNIWQVVLHSQDMQLRLQSGAHLLVYYTWWVGDLKKQLL